MKHRRALIECEFRFVVGPMLYFLTFISVLLAYIAHDMQQEYIFYLKMQDVNYLDSSMVVDKYFRVMEPWILIMCMGVFILLFSQFKNKSRLETSRFIKALPYTNKEWIITKLIMGLISFTLPYIVLAIGLILIRAQHMYWIQDKIRLFDVSRFLEINNSLSNLIIALLLGYSIILVVYSVGFLMQYLVSHRIIALVFNCAAMIAPLYIWASFRSLLGESSLGSSITHFLSPRAYMPQRADVGVMFKEGRNLSQILMVWFIDRKILFLIIISGICLVGAYYVGKQSKLENAHILLPLKWARKLLIICVGLCSMATVILGLELIFDITAIVAQLGGGVAGFIIGYFVSSMIINKVCQEGGSV